MHRLSHSLKKSEYTLVRRNEDDASSLPTEKIR